MKILLLVVSSILSPVAFRATAEDNPAVKAIEKLGGSVDMNDGVVYRVQLSDTKVTDGDLKQLATFKGLTNLELDSTQITSDGLKHLAALGSF